MALLQISFALFVLSVCAVELDPALRVDILKEMNVGESFTGVFPVQGFHNDTTAFLFKEKCSSNVAPYIVFKLNFIHGFEATRWTRRSVRASAGVAERILQKLRGRVELTLLLTLKQDKFNSGVLLSIHHGEQRYMILD
ncbi:hypothetical protein QTP70_004711 [Hemibagrus guttatus]|uniref:Uncharacterized protein n=1 Tax=Hemibagrus guttatus TaxID=175788 RepID=A0AAE0QCH0_9TELE|nr:hypothetical protein QTP70_004711 [Hemibagrus guttatus]